MVQTVNVTLDDYSPVIEYSPAGAWLDGSTVDPFWNSYSNNGTFTVTATYGASASLTFNGTAVWIYGAKRGNHGLYNITLDGHTYRDNGFYDGQVFQQVLFSALGLDGTKSHTVSIVNALTDSTRPFLDVDSIVYQMEIPDDYGEVKQQDTASSFKYSPSGWNTNPDNLASYDGHTGHSTTLGNAYVNYTFQGYCVVDTETAAGDNVELYGAVGPSGGLFTVQLDGGPQKTLNASRTKFSPQMVLYQAGGLGPGNHTMRVINAPFSGQTLTIDYVSVGQSPTNGSSPSVTPTPQPSQRSSSLSGGVIGGIVAGVSVLLVITVISLFWWYRRRDRKPAILPQDVLRAEFTPEIGHIEATHSSTHLTTPFLHSTITRYPASSAPALPSLPNTASRLVVNANNGNGGESGVGPASDDGEKEHVGVAMREREYLHDFNGSGDFEAPGNENVDMPPQYHIVVQPASATRKR